MCVSWWIRPRLRSRPNSGVSRLWVWVCRHLPNIGEGYFVLHIRNSCTVCFFYYFLFCAVSAYVSFGAKSQKSKEWCARRCWTIDYWLLTMVHIGLSWHILLYSQETIPEWRIRQILKRGRIVKGFTPSPPPFSPSPSNTRSRPLSVSGSIRARSEHTHIRSWFGWKYTQHTKFKLFLSRWIDSFSVVIGLLCSEKQNRPCHTIDTLGGDNYCGVSFSHIFFFLLFASVPLFPARLCVRFECFASHSY